MTTSCKNNESGATPAAAIQQYTIEQFMDNTNVFGSSFSPDNRELLVTADPTGIRNAYTIPVAGGELHPVTSSTGSSIYATSFFPDDERMLLRMDDNGNELWHIYLRRADGQLQDLTPDSTARAVFYGWAHDEQSFFYGYNIRDRRFMDVYEMNIADFSSTLLYEIASGFDFGGISPDKQWMALVKAINTNDSDLYLYHFPDKELKKITENKASHSPADFTTDSQALYYLTNDDSEFTYLVRYDLAEGSREKIMARNWDIAYHYFSHNGKYQVTGINEDGKNVIMVSEVVSGKAVDFPKFENGDITAVNINREENLMSFYVGSSSSPGNLYIYDFKTGEHRQLTDNLSNAINPDNLVTAEVVRFKSFDDLDIPAIYYKPHQASPEQPVPALVWVHGGPGGQSRQQYHPLIQYLVNHGYAILAVNNRGSSGYGKSFFMMDNKNHGEDDLRDCIYGKKWLAEQNYISSDEIGIIGGSYGGFMVMRAMTHTPEEFTVGVNLFGVTNWLRTLKSIPPWWESFKDALYEEMGDPAVDSVRLYNISPVFHGDKVRHPVMVLQGSKDPRVLQVESDEMVDAMKAQGVPVEYVLFPDEGHGFVKKDNQIEAYSKILNFLEKYLAKETDLAG
ncbi:MAG: alpha/beta fold hydrolase [Saprospiraceae bacterium]